MNQLQATTDNSSYAPGKDTLDIISKGYALPTPTTPVQHIPINLVSFVPFFVALYEFMLSQLYPDHTVPINNIIPVADFIVVCQYALTARLHHVHSSFTASRPTDRVSLVKSFKLPAALAAVINSIGAVVIQAGAVVCIPFAPTPTSADRYITRRATPAVIYRFNTFVTSCHAKGVLRTSPLSYATEGTTWWLLRVSPSHNPRLYASEVTPVPEDARAADLDIDYQQFGRPLNALDFDDVIYVRASFSEFTPADSLLAALVQHRFHGNIANLPLLWESELIRGAISIRSSFFEEA